MGISERFFDAFMYPFEVVTLGRRRRRLIRSATGKVLEIGAGTGANLPFYRWGQVKSLHLSDLKLSDTVKRFGSVNGTAVHHRRASAEQLPFADQEFDTVVSTLVFCSAADPERGFREIRRVLRPGGRLLFIEHVMPRCRSLRWAADLANPIWHALSRTCNLNRETLETIRSSGFSVLSIHTGIGGLLVEGTAVAA